MAETTWKKDIFVEKMTNKDKLTLDELHQANNYKNIELFSNIYAKDPLVEGMDDMADNVQNSKATMQNGLTAVQQDYSWLLAQLTNALVQFIHWYQNVFNEMDSKLLTPAVDEYVKTFSEHSSAVEFEQNVTTYNIGALEDTINNDLIENQLNNLKQFTQTQRNDAAIVKKCIYNLVYTGVATYVMYNWFYLMLYEDSDGRIKTPKPDEVWDSLWFPLRYLWRDLFQPLKVARYILLTGLPSVIKGFFNYIAICMFILLIICFYIYSNYFDFFHQMMVDLMTPGSNCAWTSTITLFVLYSFLVHMFPTIDFSSVRTAMSSGFNAAMNITTWFSTFWMAILWLILTIIRLIITIMLIPFAGIFLLIYLFGVSFFGIVCANWYNKKPHSLFMTFSLINLYIQTSIDSLHKKSCGPDNLLPKLLKLLNDVLFKWQYYILIIMVLFYNIFLCWSSLSTHTLKVTTSAIFAIFIVFTLGAVFRKFNEKLKSDTSIIKMREAESENHIRQATIRPETILRRDIRETVNRSNDNLMVDNLVNNIRPTNGQMVDSTKIVETIPLDRTSFGDNDEIILNLNDRHIESEQGPPPGFNKAQEVATSIVPTTTPASAQASSAPASEPAPSAAAPPAAPSAPSAPAANPTPTPAPPNPAKQE